MSESDSPQSGPAPLPWTWPLGSSLAQAALEKAPAIIYIYDVKAGQSVFQNRRFAELLGQPLDDIEVPSDWQRYMHPDDAMAFPEYRTRLEAIGASEVLTWTYRMRHGSGEWQHFISRDVLLETDADGSPRLIIGNATNISEQKAVEERKNLLIGEMRHRARNLMAMIDAIGRQSMPKDQPVVKSFFDSFMGRMRALLEAGDRVALSEQRMADLQSVAETALAPFRSGGRIRIAGPAVAVPEHAAGGLALALYELATNAVKYGALSRPGGSVALSWSLMGEADKPTVTMEWVEQGGPEVAPPSREGFGSRVIRNALSGRGSDVTLDFRPEGVHCRIAFPLAPQPQHG